MRRFITFLAVLLLLLGVAAPASAGDPAIVERVADTPCAAISLPPFTLSGANCTYSGQIVWVPRALPNVLPHQQMENSRFDFTFAGTLILSLDGNPVLGLVASESTTGHAMVHIAPPLPNSKASLVIPIPGLDASPYSVTVILDQAVQVIIPGQPVDWYSHLQFTKGRLLIFK